MADLQLCKAISCHSFYVHNVTDFSKEINWEITQTHAIQAFIKWWCSKIWWLQHLKSTVNVRHLLNITLDFFSDEGHLCVDLKFKISKISQYHSTAMCWEHVCFHGDREHGEGIGRGWDQLPGRGLPATVPGGEATQGWGEAGTVGIQNILLSCVCSYKKRL